jgi:Flp pilus assembly protein TadB
MPLSDHEQRILEEIERRLAEEDPRLAEQVSNTSLYTHLARRIRWASLTFLVGFVMLLLFAVSLWVAAVGFALMLLSTLLIYRYLKQMGRDQVRALQAGGRFSLAAFLARMSGRFKGGSQGPSAD